MKIGEVAKLTGTSTKTIRFYEDTGLVPPPTRTAGGHRDYTPDTADRLRFIRRCQAAGMSLQEVRQILTAHDRGESPCGHVGRLLSGRLADVRAQIAELITLEAHLETLLAHAEQGQPTDHDNAGVCWILETEPAGNVNDRAKTAAPTPAG
ncbi:heavy metal-responsive transcriptional regulator [Streptomyces sp. A3M-1-3]|uniref:heavy metal-responsive transcriptional regulator n=1 Tax=Streptomyces sp. A3M-1-3 TaxID=2962044 RepID=UPI0020B8EFB9|nr:heavy metal-responsive transcriptional regulator [Streptomyces sp. A3M-1-3]MCP3818830.1 heavy metal-responsive transcriptional regulator [Streptomyces sp. A3M-1-3]